MAIEGLVTERSLAEAKNQKLSLSAFLEKEDPTGAYGSGEKSDAFQRQLALYDIKVANNPITGERAHEFGRFWDDSDGKGAQRKLLVGEWMNRAYRAASYGIVTGERLFDAQAPLSYTVYPPTILPEMRFKQIQPSALPFLVARTRTIQTESFRALYLTDTASKTEARMSRVEEGAEIPVATFYTGENASVVRKYGRRLRYTYEQMRRMNIDLVQWGINYVAAVAARDKEDDAIDIIVNGDGNSGTAATSSNGSTYDSGAANKLTLKMLMN